MKKNPETDHYIAKAAPFAQPLLGTLREYMHRACPELSEEIKWGMPCFMYKKKILANMAAFKTHCAFGFRLSPIMEDPYGLFRAGNGEGMGDLGKISSAEQLPPYPLLEAYIIQAMSLTDQGAVVPKKSTEKAELQVPAPFMELLQAEPELLQNFNNMSPSHRREYLEWILDAKQEATRLRRMNKALEMLRKGKSLHWKYEK